MLGDFLEANLSMVYYSIDLFCLAWEKNYIFQGMAKTVSYGKFLKLVDLIKTC